jgi:hypothetical protein
VLDHGDLPGGAGRTDPAAPTLVRLASSRAGVPEGETVDLSAEVRPVRPSGGAPPTGGVVFCVGERTLGESRLEPGGVAVLRGVTLPAGVHALTASYGGDGRYAGACSPPLPQAVVAPAAPVLVAVAAPERTPEGVRLEAELLDPGTGRLVEDATGVILFVAAGKQLAQAPLVGGQASTVVAGLPEGALRVVFPGDGEHAAACGHLRVLAGS